jgi:hypothetical protein
MKEREQIGIETVFAAECDICGDVYEGPRALDFVKAAGSFHVCWKCWNLYPKLRTELRGWLSDSDWCWSRAAGSEARRVA